MWGWGREGAFRKIPKQRKISDFYFLVGVAGRSTSCDVVWDSLHGRTMGEPGTEKNRELEAVKATALIFINYVSPHPTPQKREGGRKPELFRLQPFIPASILGADF